jgi:hypothetical protein
MRLFVTYPFTFENDPLKTEYIAEVLRVEQFPDSKFGIAIRFDDDDLNSSAGLSADGFLGLLFHRRPSFLCRL